ncbi:MAG: Ig-like domain-containing protein [Cyclobacteriaceae bacterium]|jgi:photosystem II stability/assembly factor-like uncharacterized protein|nr:Ig-like domain-containing protein [Cyclobacteriaceae bacterium]
MKKIITLSFLLFAYLKISAQNNFTALSNPTGGTVIAFQFEGTKVFALEQINKQIFVTENDGTSWTRVGVGKINDPYAFYIESSTKWYYTDYGNFYTSNDGGNNWTRTGSGIRNGRKLFKLPKVGAISDVDVFVLETDCEGIFVSSNAGATWKLITDNVGCVGYNYQVAIDGNGNIYFTDYERGIRRHPVPSDDTWDKSKVTTVYNKETSGVDFNLSVGVNKVSNKVYIEHSNASGTVLRKTSTTGNSSSFVALSNGTQSLPTFNSGVWSCTPAGVMYLASGSATYELTNETTPTWTLRSKANDARGDYNVKTVEWKSNLEAYAGTDWSGVFRTTNNAASWSVANGSTTSNGILGYVGSDIEITSNGNIILKDDNGTRGVWVSTNQTSFNYVAVNPPAFLYGARWQNKLFQIGTNTLFVQSSVGTQRSLDGGLTWSNVSGTSYPVYLSPTAGEIIGMGSSFGRSTNNGATWSNITVNGMPSNYTIMYAFKSEGTNNYFVSLVNNSNNQTEYWRLDASAATWVASKLITPLTNNSFSCTGFFEINGKIYAADGQRFAYSTNQGVAWTSVQYFHQHMLPIRQGTGGIGLGSAKNLAVTQDDGINWKNFGFPTEFTNFTPRDIAFDAGNNAYITGSGGPVMKFTGNLIVPANQLPPVINFGWQNLNGPSSASLYKIIRTSTGQLYAGNSGALYRYIAAQSRWERMVIPGLLYNIFDWTVDGTGKIYAVNFNSLFISSDGGNNWTNPNNLLFSPTKIAVASNGNIIIGTTNGALISTNGGVTFNTIATLNTGSIYSLAISSTGTLFTARFTTTNQLLRSTDNGVTWAINGSGQIDISDTKEILSITALASGAVAVTSRDNVYRTTNGGTNWTSIKGNLPTNTNFGAAGLFTNGFERNSTKVFQSPSGGNLFFSNNSSLYNSADNGATWTKLVDYNTYVLTDLVWNNTDILITLNNDGVYQSTNNGTSFSKFSNNTGLALSFFNDLVINNGKFFTAGGGGKFFSSSDGQNFTEVSNTNTYIDYVSKLPNNSIVAYGGGITVSNDNGQTWTNQNPGNGYFFRLSTSGNGIYFAFRDNNGTVQLVRSPNLKDWTPITIGGSFPTSNFNVTHLANTPDEKLFVVIFNNVTGRNELYSISFGTSQLVNEVPNARSVTYYNGKIIAHSSLGNLFETTDGVTWTAKSAPAADNGLKIADNGYFFLDNIASGALWLSRDQGTSWQSVSGFNNDAAVGINVDQNTGFAYAVVNNRPVQKSSAIIIPNDNTNPVVTDRTPVQNAQNVATNFVISITYDETVKAVTAKQIRLVNTATPLNPLQTWNATNGVFSNNNKTVSFTPTVAISNLANYSIIIDQGAFTDIFGNPFAGYLNTGDWTFRTIDNSPPTITFTPANLQEGVSLSFEASVTDNELVSPTGTKIWYRKIGSPNATFTSADFTNTSGAGNLTTRNFNITVNPSWYDAMGLEFYIEAEDGSGNKGRSPADNTKYHYSYIKYTTDATSPARPKLTGLTSGSTVSSYKIIAVPYVVTDRKVGTLFNELGEANKANWRLLTYNGTDYDNLPDDQNEISRGVGYWFLQRSFTDIFIENASSPNHNRENPFKLNLKTGWNQIGNPYTLPINWDLIKNQFPNNIGVLKKFNGGFANATTLNAFEGGFVFLTGPDRVVDVPITAITTSGSRIKEVSNQLTDAHWELPILIQQGELTNQISAMGMHPEAKDDLDGFDDFNPPAPLQRLDLEFEAGNNKIAKSIQARKEFAKWNFTAHAEGNETSSLQWDNNNLGDNNYQLWLLNNSTQELTDMRLVNSISLTESKTSFTIYYGTNLEEVVKPTVNLLGNPYPNPAQTQIKIPFTVSDKNTTINITLVDNKGNEVKGIYNKILTSGFYTEEITLPAGLVPGLYLIRFQETNSTKNTSQQFRKIIIK